MGASLLWLFLAIVLAGMMYFVHVVHPMREKIKACKHLAGRIGGVNRRYNPESAEFLTWHCETCPLQIPLRELVSTPWDDTFFYLREGEERYGEKHARVEQAQREFLRSNTLEAREE